MSLSNLTPLTLQTPTQPAAELSPQTTSKQATTGIKAIPSAVFGRILSFLPAQQITRIHHVCKEWRNLPLVNDGYLDLSWLFNLTDSDLKTLLDGASGARITSLNLSCCKNITDAGLAHLKTLTSLTSIELCGTNITDTGLAHLGNLTSLTSIELYGRNITDAGLVHLSKLTLLSSLNLSVCRNITDAGLTHLSKLTLLSSLNLSRCDKITDAGLLYLGTLTSLTSLNLNQTNITDAGLAHLKTLTSLTSLDLSQTNITDAGLAHLKTLTSLTSLNLNYANITDTGLAHLGNLTSLTSIELYRTNITDAGLAHLGNLTSLTSIELYRTNITDAGLAHLVNFTSLTSLNLSDCRKITNAGLAHLATLTSLTSLNLSDCKNITDAGLAHLATLTSLTSLNLGCHKSVTDAGFAHLVLLPSLTSINVYGSKLSYLAAEAFGKKLIPIAFKDAAFRDKMDYYIYMLATEPKGGDEWGKENRYDDFDRLRLAQALAALNMSHPKHFEKLSIGPLLDLINQPKATHEQIDQLLQKLPEETRNAIFGQVYQLAPSPKGGDKWGELHRFDDPARFRLAVIEVIKNRVLLSK